MSVMSSRCHIFFGEIYDRGEPQINSLPSVLEYSGAMADNRAPKTSAELKYTRIWSHHPHIITYRKWKLYILCYKQGVFIKWNKGKGTKDNIVWFSSYRFEKWRILDPQNMNNLGRQFVGADIDTFTHIQSSKIWYKQVLFTEKKTLERNNIVDF